MSSKDKALTTTEPQQFALAVTDLSELREVMQENMGEGIPFKFERVKIPSGGNLAWQIPSEDGGKPKISESIEGVVIDHHAINAYWKKKYTGEKNPPDCASADAITGIDQEGRPHSCLICPMNQFGSAPPDEDGNESKGKACKNIRRVYLIREGEIFPVLVALPPGSLENFNDYIRRLTGKVKRLTAVKTKITLDEAVNSGGIKFSKAVFVREGDLNKESAKSMAELAKYMKPFLRQIGITEDDYATGDSAAGGGTGNKSVDAEGIDDLPDADTSGAGFTGTTIDVPSGGSLGDSSAQGGGDTGTDPGKAW